MRNFNKIFLFTLVFASSHANASGAPKEKCDNLFTIRMTTSAWYVVGHEFVTEILPGMKRKDLIKRTLKEVNLGRRDVMSINFSVPRAPYGHDTVLADDVITKDNLDLIIGHDSSMFCSISVISSKREKLFPVPPTLTKKSACCHQ